ncbi:MAG: Holliday junction resolvase RecU [Erysipelotrichaceae bacterium]|nr:Holliday junction resolvase RecU [Erysipelotrichaceae bacterium]
MIGYPNAKPKNIHSKTQTSSSNRGMTLEHDLNLTNEYYLDVDKAVIFKKPTPVQIVNVDYPKRSAAKITEAYFKTPSTTDYNGIYKGKPVDFEAKETKSKTSFPLKSIHPHQIEHLKRVIRHGGIGFFIIRFTYYDETYYIEASKLIDVYLSHEHSSVPYNWFQENGYLIPFSLTPRVDYLKIIDCYILKEVKYE